MSLGRRQVDREGNVGKETPARLEADPAGSCVAIVPLSPEIGTKMYFVREHLYYDRLVQIGPLKEYCVCEGIVKSYSSGRHSEMNLLNCSPLFKGSIAYYKIDEIKKTVFYDPREAALLARVKTEQYERAWGLSGNKALRRPWERILAEDKL